MPHPHPNENQNDFISRCMAYPDLQDKEQKQRAAICYALWKESKEKNCKEAAPWLTKLKPKT
jgi:hypothetical protein